MVDHLASPPPVLTERQHRRQPVVTGRKTSEQGTGEPVRLDTGLGYAHGMTLRPATLLRSHLLMEARCGQHATTRSSSVRDQPGARRRSSSPGAAPASPSSTRPASRATRLAVTWLAPA